MMSEKGYTKIFNWDIKAGSFALKHIIGGMFIAIAMTGLDQEMMQKNISVKTLKDSQKNIMTFTRADGRPFFSWFWAVCFFVCGYKGTLLHPTIFLPSLWYAFGETIGIIFIIFDFRTVPSVDYYHFTYIFLYYSGFK
jgi:hypothetical protein